MVSAQNQTLSALSPPVRSSSSLMIVTGALEPWLQLSTGLWWFVMVTAAVTLPLLARSLWVVAGLRRNRHFYFMSAIILADAAMLVTICCSLMVGKFAHALMGAAVCKMTLFVSNVANIFVNWTWVCMWGQRFLDVMFPMRRFTQIDSIEQTKKTLCFLLAVALLMESWTLFAVTEHIVTVEHIGGSYCDLDGNFARFATVKWIALGESIVSYLIPFILTVLADMGVLWRRSTLLMPVSRERLISRSEQAAPSTPVTAVIDCAKIQSERGMRHSVRRRQRVIVRCVLMATIDLMLNLPNYLLHLLDNFLVFSSSAHLSKIYMYVDAATYILYFLQFPFTAFYVHFLAWDMGIMKSKNQSPGRRVSVLTLASAAGTDQGIRCRLYPNAQACVQENSPTRDKSLLQVPNGHML